MARENKLIQVSVKEDEMIDLLPSPGYRFVPTDQELIRFYLRPKVSKRNLPRWNVITDRDLYKEEEPSEIFGGKLVNEMYFFTPIKKKYQNGKNIDRVITGKGAWKTQGTKEIYDDTVKSGRRLIGYKTTLNFVSNKTPANKNSKSSSWIMHEYTLNEDEQKCALCRIKRGRGNTTASNGSGGVGGVSPPRYFLSEERMDEEEEDNKLAATAALYKMASRSNLEKEKTDSGELHPVQVEQLSDETGSEGSTNEASDSDDDNQLGISVPVRKDKGKVAADDSEQNHVGSPITYKRKFDDVVKKNLTIKSSNVLTTKSDTSKDNSDFAGSSRAREPLAPNSVAESRFDIVSVDYDREIVPKGDLTFKSSKVSLQNFRNDGLNIKVVAPPDDLMQVIADSYDRIQLAGITFTSKYYSLEKQYENLQGRYTDLENQVAKMKKELNDKNLVILEKDWENKTLHDVLRNEKAGYKRKLEDIQAESEKVVDNLKVQLRKAKKTKYSKLSDLSPQPVPFDNAPRRSPE